MKDVQGHEKKSFLKFRVNFAKFKRIYYRENSRFSKFVEIMFPKVIWLEIAVGREMVYKQLNCAPQNGVHGSVHHLCWNSWGFRAPQARLIMLDGPVSYILYCVKEGED